MDVQKEREAFEAWFKEKHNLKNETKSFDLSGGEYYFPITQSSWEGWQAAKVAVPEGFILMPREMPESFDEALYVYSNNISVVDEHSNGFIPMSDIDHSEIWKLVIEAQELSHD